jgi:hypothetical protein
MGSCSLAGCWGFAADMEMEGDSNEERMLEEGDRGGHGLITGRSVVEVKKIKKRVRMFF